MNKNRLKSILKEFIKNELLENDLNKDIQRSDDINVDELEPSETPQPKAFRRSELIRGFEEFEKKYGFKWDIISKSYIRTYNLKDNKDIMVHEYIKFDSKQPKPYQLIKIETGWYNEDYNKKEIKNYKSLEELTKDVLVKNYPGITNVKENKEHMKESFQSLIRSLILEVKKEKEEKSINVDVDEAEKEAQLKQYRKGGNKPDEIDNENMAAQLQKDVNKLSKNIAVFWDDHNDLTVDAKDLFKVRISKMWENNFNVEAFIKKQDRIKVIGLNWEQVRNFVKTNFVTILKTYTTKSYEKSIQNLEDRSAKKSKELPKTEPVKQKEVEKNDKEDAVQDEKDLPHSKMSDVDDKKIKKQSDHKEDKSITKKKVSSKMDKDDDTLTVNWKK